MNCKKCGCPLNENDQFCKNCGEIVNSQTNNVGIESSMNVNNNSMNQQPMNNVQPTYSNNMSSNMNNGQAWTNYNNVPNYSNNNQNMNMNRSNGNGKYIAIGLAIVVGIIAIAFVAGIFLNKDDNKSTSGQSSNTTQTSTTNYKVSFKGFTFEIPDNLIYEERNGVLLIGNEEGTWVTQLELEQGSFTQLKANKSQLQTLMQQSGITSSIASEKTYGGVEFITLEITASGQNAIAALAKANSMYFIGITAINQNNEFDYKLLETIAPIINSAEYSGNTTNNISEAAKIDMNAISELAK